MPIDGWTYYNHAIISSLSPHETPDVTKLQNKTIWKNFFGGTPLLARWTTDFDCGYETNWWYVIKDTPFEISKLKCKRRYVINQGIKNFEINIINPHDFINELYQVQIASFSVYPSKYRPNIDEESFKQSILKQNNSIVFAAFFKKTGELCGYSVVNEYSNWARFSVQKTNPDFEKYQINAALVYGIIGRYNSKLGKNFYICDGERNILHETGFQEYLEKYFGFRKAFCNLNLVYRKPIKIAVAMLLPFRKVLIRLDCISFIHKINGVLKMEFICKISNKKSKEKK